MYAVIMAGGHGTRFWPKSKKSKPKQFLNIISDKSMLAETIELIKPLVPYEKIIIVGMLEHKDILYKDFSQIPKKNIILEPIGRNTAPCIALAALKIDDPEEIMLVLPADHLISKKDKFLDEIKNAAQILEKNDVLITFGIAPSRPDTGYGYIHAKECIADNLYKVKKFMEKPDHETAIKFLRDGNFYWNSGMFVWKQKTILEEIKNHMPDLYSQMMEIKKDLSPENIAKIYNNIEKISIDYGVMEKASNVMCIKCDIGWSDVGSWESVHELAPKDKNSNVLKGKVICIDSEGSIIESTEKLIATVGIKNLVVIESKDAILICPKEKSQEVKKIIEKLKENEAEKHL